MSFRSSLLATNASNEPALTAMNVWNHVNEDLTKLIIDYWLCRCPLGPNFVLKHAKTTPQQLRSTFNRAYERISMPTLLFNRSPSMS